jgi:LysM repeat protein
MRILIVATLLAMAVSLPGVITLAYGEQGKEPKTTKTMEQNSGPNIDAQAKAMNMHGQEYTVKKGDTLAEIAEMFMGTQEKWQEIARANHLENPDRIDVGDRLLIPAASGSKKDDFEQAPRKQNLGNTAETGSNSDQMDENTRP